MKNLLKKALFIISCTSSSIYGMEAVTVPPKVIIWDVGGVLTKSASIWHHLSHLSFTQVHATLRYMWEKNTTSLKTHVRGRFFEMLEAIHADVVEESILKPEMKKFIYAKESERTRTTDGLLMPHLLCGYQSGQFTAQEIRDLIGSKIESLRENFFSSENEEVLLQTSVSTAFNPERFAPSETPREEVVQLLQEVALITNGSHNKLFINVALSNWDPESFALIKALRAELFAHFDHFFISGERHVLKPNERAFNNIFEELHVTPKDCLFIDDQKENIEAAEQLGIRAHLFTTAENLRIFLLAQSVNISGESDNV